MKRQTFSRRTFLATLAALPIAAVAPLTVYGAPYARRTIPTSGVRVAIWDGHKWRDVECSNVTFALNH